MKYFEYDKIDWQKSHAFLKKVFFTAEDLQNSGTKFQIAKFKPGTEIKKHYHKKTVEIFYIISGAGELELNKKVYQLKPNDIFLCEPGDTHIFRNNTQEDLVFLVFKTNEKEKDIFWT